MQDLTPNKQFEMVKRIFKEVRKKIDSLSEEKHLIMQKHIAELKLNKKDEHRG